MIQHKVKIKNRFGLHARPASHVVEMADRFESDIYFVHGDHKANGRSILDVMSVAAGACELLIIVDGSDEEEALEGLLKVLLEEVEVEI